MTCRGKRDLYTQCWHNLRASISQSRGVSIQLNIYKMVDFAVRQFPSRNRADFGFKNDAKIGAYRGLLGFPSRNRGTFGFKPTAAANQYYYNYLFPSRNRGTFGFKSTQTTPSAVQRTGCFHLVIEVLLVSRTRSLTKHGSSEQRFHLVIEVLLVSSVRMILPPSANGQFPSRNRGTFGFK